MGTKKIAENTEEVAEKQEEGGEREEQTQNTQYVNSQAKCKKK